MIVELFGQHKVSADGLRALAIQCHALDMAGAHLFLPAQSTHVDESGRTKATYEELFTSHVLALAIALRTKFYQGADHKATIRYMSCCGFLDKTAQGKTTTDTFSMKDVADKVIHADTIHRFLEPGVKDPVTTLRGRRRINGVEESWELSFSMTLFTEAVLNWLQDIGS